MVTRDLAVNWFFVLLMMLLSYLAQPPRLPEVCQGARANAIEVGSPPAWSYLRYLAGGNSGTLDVAIVEQVVGHVLETTKHMHKILCYVFKIWVETHL